MTETYKGLITLTVEALKLLGIVNGGGAIAVLMYLGNLLSHADNPPPDMRSTLIWYCLGLSSTMLAFVVAYISQLTLYNEAIERRTSGIQEHRHKWGVYIGIALALFSVAAFVVGSYEAVTALGAPVTTEPDRPEAATSAPGKVNFRR